PPGACDTHAHLFGPTSRFPYQRERSYTPPDATEDAYRHMLRTLGFSRAVLVQPSVYGTDNRRMLETLSARRPDDDIQWRGVAVVDRDVTDAELERLHAVGVRGIRMNLLFPGGIDFAAMEQLGGRIADLGWHAQLFVDVSRFDRLAERVSRLRVDAVVDHMGYMATSKGLKDPGFQDLLALLRDGRTWVKLSGPNRITALDRSPYTDVDPFLTALLEARSDRCVFGTDWPHVQLSTPMPNDGSLVDEFLRLVTSPADRQAILVDNPARLYGFRDTAVSR
ncbi:MAG: amidohydrolase family protein, partial [Burkholderiales bacterium]